MNITVFCASSSKINQKYFDSTTAIAKHIAETGKGVVYGGGNVGLMGCLADTALANGGYVIGIIPEFMKVWERAHEGCQELIFTDNMRDRKLKLLVRGDAVLILPGSVGTMDELFEAFTLKRLNRYDKPIIIFNQDGFYDALISLLNTFIDEQFMGDEPLYQECKTVEETTAFLDKL